MQEHITQTHVEGWVLVKDSHRLFLKLLKGTHSQGRCELYQRA